MMTGKVKIKFTRIPDQGEDSRMRSRTEHFVAYLVNI